MAGVSAAPKQDLADLREKLDALRDDLRASEQSRSDVAEKLRKSEVAISRANRELRDLSRKHAAVVAKIGELEAQSNALKTQIDAQQRKIAEGLRDRYVNGRTAPLRLALSGGDPNRVARDLHYLSYVARARAALVDGLRDNLARVAELARQAADRAAELDRLKQKQAEQRQALEREKAERSKVLASISSDLRRQRHEYATLKQDEERLAELVAKLAATVARPPSRPGKALAINNDTPEPVYGNSTFRSLKGKLRLPVVGELVRRFGSPRGDDGFSRKGIFIRAHAGQEVKAVANGRVVFADWMRGFGNLLIIDHGGGYMSLYGNNEALYKTAGDPVRAGDAVAAVGASGGQEESGLYFELRHEGKAIDPLPWAPPRQ